MTKFNNPEDQYIRVGTQYFKIVERPSIYKNNKLRYLEKWTMGTIKGDHGDILKNINKYDAFCCIPSHTEYHQVVDNCYNRYHELSHNPSPGNFKNIQGFLSHIFGEQLELGYDYIQLLYLNPRQILPILCLVSEERNTGKTTFLDFLKSIFGFNMTKNKNDDFRSQFNADWTNKLIVGIDEVLLERMEDSERLKELSTAKTVKTEAKGIDKVEEEFFGKFILCSNNETTFVKIDNPEIRYWVRKVSSLKSTNDKLLDTIKEEIPAFLHFLIHRELSTKGIGSRMWFRPNEIWTPALSALKQGNKTYLEQSIEDLISEYIKSFNLLEAHFQVKDIADRLKSQGTFKVDYLKIRQIIKNRWKLKPVENPSRYKIYFFNNSFNEREANPELSISYHSEKGRYFTFPAKDFLIDD